VEAVAAVGGEMDDRHGGRDAEQETPLDVAQFLLSTNGTRTDAIPAAVAA
jgi:hypothetical protein